MTEWNALPDTLQLHLADMALRQAAFTVAGHAEALAEEMETGSLSDAGGPDALRLLAAVIRAANEASMPVCGHA